LVLTGNGPYADLVAQPEACLVDVYDTILTCDFAGHGTELPVLAGMPALAWQQGYLRIDDELSTGRLTKSEGFGQILREFGVEPRPDLVRALVKRDRDLLLAAARLYDDAIPFLESLRSRGIKIAIVSNCTEHTRQLLTELGVDALADALVLSCEVGVAKPAAEIFQYALDRLGVAADATVFVDDQRGYCAGAVALGIRTAWIVRGELDGEVPAPGTTLVRSLLEVEAMIGAEGLPGSRLGLVSWIPA
jgi:putative hydrolase of the HAD superfamily